MTRAPKFEDFGSASPAAAHADAVLRQAGWDAGYAEGVKDGARSAGDAQARATADLAQNIADCAFGYHEARAALAPEVAALLSEIVSAVLPDLALSALGPQIDAALAEVIHSVNGGKPELRVHPDQITLAREAAARASVEMSVTADPHLAPLEADLRTQTAARRIDLGAVLSAIEHAVASYTHALQQEARNV